jgi:hypothetical protein
MRCTWGFEQVGFLDALKAANACMDTGCAAEKVEASQE